MRHVRGEPSCQVSKKILTMSLASCTFGVLAVALPYQGSGGQGVPSGENLRKRQSNTKYSQRDVF